MATLKDVQIKIGAIKKTKQITKAMNMVAASKLRGAQNAMEAFRPFSDKFAEVLGSLAEKAGEEANPLLVPRDKTEKINIVLCTSDRGLCGGFNTHLLNKAKLVVSEKSDNDIDISFTNFGRKGRDWCRKNDFSIGSEHLGIMGSTFDFNIASAAGKKIVDDFLSGEYDEVYILYSEFVTVAKQTPALMKILPIPPIVSAEDETEDKEIQYLAEHICEPSPTELLGDMLPRNIYVQLFRALLETCTSEHAARMTAMDNATKACNDMIDNLTLAYNKARQAAITADLMDIVGGAEALKG